ncbi:unnamed protein product [Rotaria sordida]|uniref:Mos1 transposase HTH domain-containing protein n=1 Tax=Rotaria sordida TaxID=392033 RepID=A0A814T203_9BILA|nr:unnamed protein product [Rotaria sordida]CAF3713097.1 unnamed protein product [Rotaria sordida]
MDSKFNRYYIKIRTVLEIDAKTICEDLTEALESDTSSYSKVKRWAKHFREERGDVVNEDYRAGRSVSVLTDENIERIQQVIEDNLHSTYDDIIAETSLFFMVQ